MTTGNLLIRLSKYILNIVIDIVWKGKNQVCRLKSIGDHSQRRKRTG